MACVFFITAHEPALQRFARHVRWGRHAALCALRLAIFGSVGRSRAWDEVLPQTRCVELDLHRLVQLDTSGLEALRQLHQALQRRGVVLRLLDVNVQPLSLMHRSGFAAELGEGQLRTAPGSARRNPASNGTQTHSGAAQGSLDVWG